MFFVKIPKLILMLSIDLINWWKWIKYEQTDPKTASALARAYVNLHGWKKICFCFVFNWGPIKLAESHFSQIDTLARLTVWPEWPFGQRQFGWRDSLASDSLARVTFWPEWLFGQSDTLARVTLWPETLWPEWHFGQFFLLPLGYQRVKNNSIGGTIGKNLKKIIITFQEKKDNYFFQRTKEDTIW